MSSSSRKPRHSKKHPDWESLPRDLQAGISRRLTSIYDYLAVRGVCKSWRSAATHNNFDRDFPQVPWLMFAVGKGKEVNRQRDVYLLDPSRNKTCKIVNFLPFPATRYLSSGGWILCVGEDSPGVSLRSPFCSNPVGLPGLDTFPAYEQEDGISDRFIEKMVLSGSLVIDDDVVVMVIWGKGERRQLGFSRPGDSTWTVIDSSDHSFCDIIYHNRRLYALDSNQRIVECDIHGPNPTQIVQIFGFQQLDLVPYQELFYTNRYLSYLVESSGKFLIVVRLLSIYETLIRFAVLEVDLANGVCRVIQDIGHTAVFLGSNSSFCLQPSGWDVIRPNCIYFTDHFSQRDYSNAGVYHLSDHHIDLLGKFWTAPTLLVPGF